MSTMGRPSSYSPDFCELAHNYCVAVLDAAGESVRHAVY
jgi:hypothetical protein